MAQEVPVNGTHRCPDIVDQEVVMHGEKVFMTSLDCHVMEAWVRKVAAASGQRVDWYYGGFAIVRALGDIGKVKAAIIAHLPEHDALYEAYVSKLNLSGLEPMRPDWMKEMAP